MTRPHLDAAWIAELARLAGFDFAPERCEILAPQVEWLLVEARKVSAVERDGLEPANVFDAARWGGPRAGGEA